MRNNKTIFYSWLSDLPSRANKKLIRNALRSAAMEIDEKNEALHTMRMTPVELD